MEQLRKRNAQAPADERMTEEELRELERMSRMPSGAGERHTPDGVGFQWYQPLTCAFLHGGLMHFAGNMLFLIVFGMRVNELVGNLKFAIIYPVLAVCSALAYLASASGPVHPMLGASGAIMGLAGMYFVFFPIQKVHTAIWLRVWSLVRLRTWCGYKVFAMRGFWLLLLWIGFNDGLPMLLGSRDGVAHWAHMGGFLSGAGLALLLMITRQTNAGGADILSVTLGKKAWAILGKPSGRAGLASKPETPGDGLPRAISMNYE